MLMKADDAYLLVVDVQEKLTPLIHNHEMLLNNCRWLMTYANEMAIPIVVSEQYPKGLGRTVPQLAELAPQATVLEKMHFSCAADKQCLKQLNSLGKSQVIIVGIEAHVCVLQTAMQLAEANHDVFVVTDAVSSRHVHDIDIAFKRMQHSGIHLVTREMVFFECLHKAGTEQFKSMSRRCFS